MASLENEAAVNRQTAFLLNSKFHLSQHVEFLMKAGNDRLSVEALLTEQLRMGGAYWAITALWSIGLMGCKCSNELSKDVMSSDLLRASNSKSGKREDDSCHTGVTTMCSSCKKYGVLVAKNMKEKENAVYDFILTCKADSGGYSFAPKHEPHVTSTHYALLLLCGLGRLDAVDRYSLAAWIKSLECPIGMGFRGDSYGEVDSRFVYSAVASLSIIGQLDSETASRCIAFIQKLKNYDGGFAWIPGGESHAASAFCCVAALALCEGIWCVDKRTLAMWLLDRQTPSGGFNGRPEKAPDVCYSFWIAATLHIIGYSDWYDRKSLTEFILCSQDPITGGIADRPEDMGDVFHTYFGFAALGMMKVISEIEYIHPVWSLPLSTVQQIGLPVCITWD